MISKKNNLKKTISLQFNSTAIHLAPLCDCEMRQICISFCLNKTFHCNAEQPPLRDLFRMVGQVDEEGLEVVGGAA